MITKYPFDDSLITLDKRQTPPTQTQRGNYEWSWCSAGFVTVNLTQATLLWKKAIGPAPASGPQVLLFGADVPHLATLIAGYPAPLSFHQQLQAYITAFNAWAAAFAAWAPTFSPNPPIAPAPTGNPSSLPRVCNNAINVAVRSTLRSTWGATDAGQGALVECRYTNLFTEDVFVQGFPLSLVNPTCGPNPLGDFAPDAYVGALLVGYSSATNHGIGFAAPTPNTQPPLQSGYVPIIYPRAFYTPAIRAAGNVITNAGITYRVMGLWDD